MGFVDDGLRPGMPRRPILVPVEMLLGEHAFRHRSGVVDFRSDPIGLRRECVVPERRFEIPVGKSADRPRKRVQEQLVEIEAVSFVGLVRAVHAVAVELAGEDAFDPHVPHVARAVARGIQIDRPHRRRVRGMVEKLQPDAARVAAEEREVDAALGFTGSQRERIAPAHFGAFGNLREVVLQRAFRCLLVHVGSQRRARRAISRRPRPRTSPASCRPASTPAAPPAAACPCASGRARASRSAGRSGKRRTKACP